MAERLRWHNRDPSGVRLRALWRSVAMGLSLVASVTGCVGIESADDSVSRLVSSESGQSNGAVGVALSATPSSLQGVSGIWGCTVAPALPPGLAIHPYTCTVSGTPTTASEATYTITAMSVAGPFREAQWRLRVVPSIPGLSYSASTGTSGLVGTPMSVSPTVLQERGAAISLCSSTPALPTGLSIHPATCVISGTPTATANGSYTIRAYNSAGSSLGALVQLSVAASIPVLSYSGSTDTVAAVGESILVIPSTLQSNGASISNCVSVPSLPVGLSLSPTTCEISGALSGPLNSTFTVSASNSVGSSSGAVVHLTVSSSGPTLSYSASIGMTSAVGLAMSVVPSTLQSNGSEIWDCVVSPSLPFGLSIHPTTCVISGVPTVTTNKTYKVRAKNLVGVSAAASVPLIVNPSPPTLSYASSSGKTGAVGVPMSITPSTYLSNGSPVTDCASTPALPSGLAINLTTCVISGVPTATANATYTIRATNSAGASSGAAIQLIVNPSVPSLSYSGSTGATGSVGVVMSVSPATLLANGAAITNCASTPTLPSGLTINPTTCVISGVPSGVSSATYTIRATNSVGNSPSAMIQLIVHASVPTLSFSGSTGNAGNVGVSMSVSPTTLLANGAAVTNCTSAPSLPSGLSVHPATCVISGMPTGVSNNHYTIRAINSVGTSADTTVQLIISASAPTISFAGATGTTVGAGVIMSVSPTTLWTNGAPVTNCFSTPALPSGLTISPTTCVISGTPTSAASGSYSITATNSAGSSAATVTLVVRQPRVVISSPTPSGSIINGTAVSWRLDYLDVDQILLSTSHLILGGTGTSGCVLSVSVPGATPSGIPFYRTVTASGCVATSGTLNLSVTSGSGSDSLSGLSTGSAGPSSDVTFVTPVISFQKPDAIFPEGNSSGILVSVPVVMTPAIHVDATVSYSISGEYTTVAMTTDTDLQAGSIVIPAGQTSGSINFSFYGDSISNSSRFVQLSLSGVSTSQLGSIFTVGSIPTQRLKFRDDDGGSPDFIKVAAGTSHACGINSLGVLKCWGANTNGQLGDGSTTQRSVPQVVDSGVSYQAVAAGGSYTCGITSLGAVKCWGYNFYGQLGDGSFTQRTTPVVVDSGVSYQSIAAGGSSTCGITTSGILKCWGNTSTNPLGSGPYTTRNTPGIIDSGVGYQAITTGGDHACGITTSGILKCWRANGYGQLGDGTTTNRATPVVIDSGVGYQAIAAGNNHTCGITISGVLKCWGSNSNGRLGDGTTTQRLAPVIVDSDVGYQAIATGSSHTCGITISGVLKCWGSNSSGRLGDGTLTQRTLPVTIDSDVLYQRVVAGGTYSCGLTTLGALKCWGDNSSGQLGDATLPQRALPVKIDLGVLYQAVSSASNNTYAITSSGALKYWGNPHYSPILIDSGVSYQAVAGGVGHTCGITASGVLKCGGGNSSGQLGDGTTTTRNSLAVVDSGVSYQAITAGNGHTCGITSAGALKCWGSNSYGQLGDGSTTQKNIPTLIDPGVSYQMVSSTVYHTCGVTVQGVLKCWGWNDSGRLGDGTSTNRSVPTVIDAGVQYQAVAAGGANTCGITASGLLKCWGSNGNGQVGDGTTTTKSIPTSVDLGTGYRSVVAGTGGHVCGISTADVLKCWGWNNSGQLGDGSGTNRLSPVTIDSGTSYLAIGVGNNHTCGITTAGELKCWGTDGAGQLGRGRLVNWPSPVVD